MNEKDLKPFDAGVKLAEQSMWSSPHKYSQIHLQNGTIITEYLAF